MKLRCSFLHYRNEIIDKVKHYIKNFLNPLEINFYPRDNFVELKSVSNVSEEVNIIEQEYKNIFKISDDNS